MRGRSNARRTRPRARSDNAGVADVMNAIRALVAALSQSARAVEQDTGVTNAQLFVLRELARREPLSINDIAGHVMTRQSTVSLLVARLVGSRLVRRHVDDLDARRVLISLTPRGRRIVERAPEPPTAAVLRAIRKLSPHTRTRLNAALTELLDLLGLSRKDSPPLFERVGPAARRPRARRDPVPAARR